jgi:Fic family protein
MSDPETNIRILDAAYRPFPTFEEWAAQTTVDTVRWDRYNSFLKSLPQQTPERMTRALEIAKRAAALDTGAIEGLYEVDSGVTYTVAVKALAWDLALARRGENVRSLFEAQLHAYDYVLDLATKAEPISEASIRALHEVACRAQDTYRVMTAVGPQDQSLPKGQYKVLPNHVRTRKGTDHSYAPVDVTPGEMDRLVRELRSDKFLTAHPVLQAAYAHYGLVVIHPFADGNGRVARALASAFTYRAISMPIVILSEHKNAYLDALESADSGNRQPFVDFMLARCLDTITLVSESVRSAQAPTLEASLTGINRFYFTKSGFSFEEVDAAGSEFMKTILTECKNAIETIRQPKLTASLGLEASKYSAPVAHRLPLGGGQQLYISMATASPLSTNLVHRYQLLVPKNASGEDDIQLIFNGKVELNARVDEIIPVSSGVFQIRVRMFAERTILEMLDKLRRLVEAEYKKRF